MADGTNDNDTFYLVGLDGGGTQCRASIYNLKGTFISAGLGGPANPVNGLALAKQSILESIEEAIKNSQQPITKKQLIVGAGLAGLHLPQLKQKMQNWQHPFHSLHFTTDIHCALLGAHKGQEGAVIVLGTGFSALGQKNGEFTSIGGYGFPINATASGAWFGLEAIKAILLDYDKIGPKTSMTQSALEKEDILHLATRLNNAAPFEFAKYAPLVFKHAENGDAVALELTKQSIEFTENVINRLTQEGYERFAFIGGVSRYVASKLTEQTLKSVYPIQHSPEYGAMLFALQQENTLKSPIKINIA